MANGKKYSVVLTHISCEGTSELGGANDEVAICYQADAGVPVRYPATGYQRMNTAADSSNDVLQTWYVNLELDFDYEVLVTLWDQDLGGDNNTSEFLANKVYTNPTDPAASYQMSNNNGAIYTFYATAGA